MLNHKETGKIKVFYHKKTTKQIDLFCFFLFLKKFLNESVLPLSVLKTELIEEKTGFKSEKYLVFQQKNDAIS